MYGMARQKSYATVNFAMVEAYYSVLNENQQLFASKYLPYLPTEEELKNEIERQKIILKLQKH